MDAIAIYAITAGGIFATLFLTRTLFSRHLTLPFMVDRHQLWGPWTLISALLYVSYAIINLFLILFRMKSWSGAGRQAGELTLVNLIFLLSATHLSYLADLVSITCRTCRRIHRAVGWMTVALVSFHIVVEVQNKQFSFPLHSMQNLFTLIGACSLGVLSLLSIPWFRHFSALCLWNLATSSSPEPALKNLPPGSAGDLRTDLISTDNDPLLSKRAVRRPWVPRAVVSFSAKKTKEEHPVITAAHIRILLPRPSKVEAGQYINLLMPSISLSSWMQTHPFTVVSWSRDRQDTIELLLQPRDGLSADLVGYAPAAKESSIYFLALFTGPHGMVEDVSHYGSVLVVTSGFGIAAAIPYLKKMIYGYDTCTSQVRRLHLMWEVKSVVEMAVAQTLLNNLLEDDIMNNGYVRTALDQTDFLSVSMIGFCLYQGLPDYQNIVSLEASGDQIERLPNVRDKQGRTLVMVSAADGVRDHIRKTVRGRLHQGVKLFELEYQPCAV
ncbi:hypothetical protein N7471_013065 [Penicillium samsonianum]|uniref:uncharacterized protein n=1 Tax=Penicillium samsonianum TaxID=1882272 RepID=UPI002547F945|nr:uncharacterized protein N7471_013065 [Penicillium samsonianum]KAJ6119114.1 hypothetical protein N7471_013065 [Penicillium samsonianum]